MLVTWRVPASLLLIAALLQVSASPLTPVLTDTWPVPSVAVAS